MNATKCRTAARALAACLVAAASAAAADYDYRVEYVKSTHGSCVKTDLVPRPGTTFRMDVRFDGPFNQIFGGKFDHAKNTTVFFGQTSSSSRSAGTRPRRSRPSRASGGRAARSGSTADSRR